MKWKSTLKGDKRTKTRFLIFPKLLPLESDSRDPDVLHRDEWRWMCWATWEQEVKAVQARRGDYKYLEWRDTCWIGKP